MKWCGELREGRHAPIIDGKLWEKTQKVMKVSSYIQEKVHPGSFPLSGLLKCPECSSPMVQGNSSPKYKYYQCSRNKNSGSKACSSNLVKKEYSENYVYNQVFIALQKHNIIEPITSILHTYAMSEIEPLETKIKTYEVELDELKTKRKKLINLKLKEIISEEILKEEIQDLQEEKKTILSRIDNLKHLIKLRDKTFLANIISSSLQDLKKFFDIIEDTDKKKLLRSLISEIHVNPGNTTKDRTIKEIIYKFDLKYLSNLK